MNLLRTRWKPVAKRYLMLHFVGYVLLIVKRLTLLEQPRHASKAICICLPIRR